MCLTRLILAGVGQVYHAVDDPSGGMVYRLSHFTPEWLVLSARQTFAEADISSELKSIARQVFLLMADISIAQMREHSCSEVAG